MKYTFIKQGKGNADRTLFNQAELKRYVEDLAAQGYTKDEIIMELTPCLPAFLEKAIKEKNKGEN